MDAAKAMDKFLKGFHDWNSEREIFGHLLEGQLYKAALLDKRPLESFGLHISPGSKDVINEFQRYLRRKTMNKITMEGNWQTEDGRPVRIISLDGPKDTPVVGVIEGNPNVLTWMADGQYNPGVSHLTDLVPVPTKHVAWAWISDDGRVLGFCGEGRENMEKRCESNEHVRMVTWEE